MRSRYPSVVDDVTVRLIAGIVLVVVVAMLALQQWWLFVPLAVDFLLRATLGPQASPIARFVSVVVRPRVRALPRPTPGTPKRFAAAIGATMTVAATVLWLAHLVTGADWPVTGVVVVAGIMTLFPALEALAGLCVGCVISGWLMRTGLVPEEICVECADITTRLRASSGVV